MKGQKVSVTADLIYSELIMLLILAIILLGAYCQAQCPSNCLACSNSTTCSSCPQSYTLVSSKFCAPCPSECLTCTWTSALQPICSTCVANAQMGSNSRCFTCDPSCQTCANQPSNCLSCKPGLVRSVANNLGICKPNQECTFENCLACSTDGTGYKYCSLCPTGYFNFREGCSRCNYPCSKCTFNSSSTWSSTISVFWSNLVKPFINSGQSLPAFVNNGDFNTMKQEYKRGWIEAFFVYKALEKNLASLTITQGTLNGIVTFYDSVKNQSAETIRKLSYNKVNQLLGLSLDFGEYELLVQMTASQFSTCSDCMPGGYFLNTTSNVCLACSQYCTVCPGGVCTACQPGRYPKDGVCLKCKAECSECSGLARNCSKCRPPYSLVESTCVLCSWPCQTCLANNLALCTSCRRPFSRLSYSSGACYSCEQALCLRCLASNQSICLECQNGTSLVDGRCSPCPSNCLQCSGGSPQVCFKCPSRYVLSNNDCVACGPGCLQCSSSNSSLCLSCQQGTYLNVSTGKCLLCQQGCELCGQNGCLKLAKGFVGMGSAIMPCRPGCRKCDSANQESCLVCEQPYYSDNGTCRKCDVGCEKCVTVKTCTKCLDTYALYAGYCLRCSENCLLCSTVGSTNATACEVCKSGTVLVGGACQNKTINGCLQPSATNNDCQTCDEGYALNSLKQCIKCVQTCTGQCDAANINVCLKCADGSQFKDGACIQCPLGCSSCSNGNCNACFEGYSLAQISDGALTCSQDCLYPCAQCSGSACLNCEYGFTLSNSACISDTSCNPSCPSCPRGTFRNGTQACGACPSSCAACLNGQACLECEQGYFLANSGKCLACPAQCKTCLSFTVCTTCAQGYTKEVVRARNGQADTLGQACLPCSSKCKRCFGQPNRCASCPKDFRVYGLKCCGLYTVRYQYELLTDFKAFLANYKSSDFVAALSSKLGINQEDNFIQEIKEGSTIVMGAISASDYNDAVSIQNKLSSTVPGFTVLSYSSTIYEGSQVKSNKDPSSPNVGLIVGVTIGAVAVLALIAFIIVMVYRKKFKKKEEERNVGATSSQKEINEQWKMHI